VQTSRRWIAAAISVLAIAGLAACGDDHNPEAANAFAEIVAKHQAAAASTNPLERERLHQEVLAAIYAAMRRYPSSDATEALERGEAVGELSIPRIEEALTRLKAVNAAALLAQAQAQFAKGQADCTTYECYLEALRGTLAIVEKLTQKYWETEAGAAIRTPIVIEEAEAKDDKKDKANSLAQLPELSVDNMRCMIADAEVEAAFKPRLEEVRVLEERGDGEAGTPAKLASYTDAREKLAAVEREAEALVARRATAGGPRTSDLQLGQALPAIHAVCQARSWTLDRLVRQRHGDGTLYGVNATRLRDKTLEAMRIVTGSRTTEPRPPETRPKVR